MTPLDPADLVAYARRAWDRLERLSIAERVRRSPEEKLRLADALRETARLTCPGWPTDEHRLADLAHHRHLARLLRRAAHVGAR